MKLENIIRNCGILELHGDAGAEILSVTNDSRKAGAGCLFIAVNGCGNDGRAYLGAAAAAEGARSCGRRAGGRRLRPRAEFVDEPAASMV